MKNFNIKKWLTTFAVIGSVVGTCTTQASSVWQVKKGEDVVYLGGTVHLLPASEFPLPEQYADIYAKTDSIVLEAKLPDAADTEAQMKVLKAMSFEPGKTLSDVVTPQTYQQLKEYFAGLGVALANMAQFKPGFIATMMMSMEAQRAQMAGQGVDAYFAEQAKKDGKPQEYLETMDFQLQMLANQGLGDEDKMLQSSLEEMAEFVPMMKSLVKAWRTGDEQALNELVIERVREASPQTFKTVFSDRNQDWIIKIERMFGDQDKEFVLVGVGHLVGEQSVVAMLKQKGYEVSKL